MSPLLAHASYCEKFFFFHLLEINISSAFTKPYVSLVLQFLQFTARREDKKTCLDFRQDIKNKNNMSASPHKMTAHFQEAVAILNYIIHILLANYVSLAPLHIH